MKKVLMILSLLVVPAVVVAMNDEVEEKGFFDYDSLKSRTILELKVKLEHMEFQHDGPERKKWRAKLELLKNGNLKQHQIEKLRQEMHNAYQKFHIYKPDAAHEEGGQEKGIFDHGALKAKTINDIKVLITGIREPSHGGKPCECAWWREKLALLESGTLKQHQIEKIRRQMKN